MRAVLEALDAVPPQVRDAATAVGYRPITRMLKVELPLSIPVLVAGLRVVVVTNISMVSVGSVIGIGGLGTWFTEGYQANKSDQIVAGIIAIFVLAVVIDIADHVGRPAGHAVGTRHRSTGRRLRSGRRWWAARDELPRSRRCPIMFTAANWAGPVGLAARILEHLEYTAAGRGGLGADRDSRRADHRAHRPRHVAGGRPASTRLRALPTLGVLLLGCCCGGWVWCRRRWR